MKDKKLTYILKVGTYLLVMRKGQSVELDSRHFGGKSEFVELYANDDYVVLQHNDFRVFVTKERLKTDFKLKNAIPKFN